MCNQKTIDLTVSCAGIGVHLGQKARLCIKPAPAGHGIRFRRTDTLASSQRDITACAHKVSGLMLGTTLTNEYGDSVATVEHLMAACIGMGLDNLLIEIDGPEVPIMDGSATVFCNLLADAGYVSQNAPRRLIRVLKQVDVHDGNKWARLSPTISDALSLRARIDFDNPVIGIQEASMRLSPGTFGKDAGFARTFGFFQEVETLQKQGYALGGSLENAIIIDDEQVINPEGLRSEDEFVRHKLLDAIGDLALAGGYIAGLYEAERPGHALNNALLRKFLNTPDAWAWETMTQASEHTVEAYAGMTA